MNDKKKKQQFVTVEEFCTLSGRCRNNVYEFRRSKFGRQFFHRFPGERRLYVDWPAYEAALLKQTV